jgi:hypothetical protein
VDPRWGKFLILRGRGILFRQLLFILFRTLSAHNIYPVFFNIASKDKISIYIANVNFFKILAFKGMTRNLLNRVAVHIECLRKNGKIRRLIITTVLLFYWG